MLLFIPVPEGKSVKNRVHVDVGPFDGHAMQRSSG